MNTEGMQAEKVALALDRLSQSLRESALQADRATRELMDLDLTLVPAVMTTQAPPPNTVETKHPEPAKVSSASTRPTYPRLVDKVTIDWEQLRMVAVSRLATLLRDGTYIPRVSSDRGYMWLAEQLGVSGAIRDFLIGETKALSAELFIRMCRWLGYSPEEFIDVPEDNQ